VRTIDPRSHLVRLGDAMVYRNRKSAFSFLIAGAVVCSMAYFSLDYPPADDEPKGGPESYFLFGGFLALVGVNGLIARIEVNTEGLRRRSWFGLVNRFYPWEQLLSWKFDQVPQDQEDSAGTWYVEFEFPGPFRPYWVWIKETHFDSAGFFAFVEDVRTHVKPKERVGSHGAAIVT
jgi:hypothetical protein